MYRNMKFASTIKKTLSVYCLKYFSKMIIHHIIVSKNLAHAKIFFTCCCLKDIQPHIKKMRLYIANKMRLKFVPQLSFFNDDKYQSSHNAFLKKLYEF